jgi:predicted DsbA family dithiol-disulfide isomerase
MKRVSTIPASMERNSNGAAPALSIDVFFDFVCPWCLIGSRQLKAAMSRFADLRADVKVGVRWRSCELLPETPAGGVDYQAFYLARLGSAENVAARRRQVREAGKSAGIDFRFERIGVLPNTAAAHALVALAGDAGTGALRADLIESLFTAYFMEGEDIGDLAVLEERAVECGMERGSVREHLAGWYGRFHRAMDRRSQKPSHPIGGVPLFVFDESFAVSGAASAETLLDAMLRSVRDRRQSA